MQMSSTKVLKSDWLKKETKVFMIRLVWVNSANENNLERIVLTFAKPPNGHHFPYGQVDEPRWSSWDKLARLFLAAGTDLVLTICDSFFCVCESAGSSYYDNVRPLAYPDSDAVLICFDISRPETLDSVIKKVSGLFFIKSSHMWLGSVVTSSSLTAPFLSKYPLDLQSSAEWKVRGLGWVGSERAMFSGLLVGFGVSTPLQTL